MAAHGFALLRGRPSATVVLVGPAHRSVFDGVAVYARGAFETPLGRVSVAEDLADALIAADPRLYAEPRPHRDEHSLEMQLPFLQHLVGDLKIVPMLMGSQSRAEIYALAGALSRVLPGREDVLLLASSDLSPLPPRPRGQPDGRAGGGRRGALRPGVAPWSASSAATSAPAAAGRSWR